MLGGEGGSRSEAVVIGRLHEQIGGSCFLLQVNR
jgi:hypothetical protein